MYKDSNQKKWTFSRKTMNLYSHAGRANSCKKNSCFPPCTKREETLGRNRNKFLRRKKKREIQVQMLKFDKISGVLWESTCIGIMWLQGRNSIFRRTIFRYLWITLMFRKKQNNDVLQEANIGDYGNFYEDKSLSEPWIGVTRFALLNKNSPEGILWVQGRQQDQDILAGKNWSKHVEKLSA